MYGMCYRNWAADAVGKSSGTGSVYEQSVVAQTYMDGGGVKDKDKVVERGEEIPREGIWQELD